MRVGLLAIALRGRGRAVPAAALGLLASIVGLASPGCRAADEPPRRRFAFARITFDPRGVSPPLRVPVPPRTRSMAVVVDGDPGALYALAGLETADGVDRVSLPAGVELGAAMRAAYFDDRSGQMPGRLRQTIRLALFTAVYPDRPDAPLPAGDVVVRVATSDPSSPVDVAIVFAEALPAGRAVLPVVLFWWSAPPGSGAATAASARGVSGLPFVARLRSILATGGVDLRVERVIEMKDPVLARMTELSEPQEPPTGASARLAVQGGALAAGDALALYVVDSLPAGVGGWTLGTPGPPVPDTIYSGVVAARLDMGDELARVLAHEIGHYLGLWHVEHTSRRGAVHADPLADTAPGAGNLMDEDRRGTQLTPDQSAVMRLHPLVRAR